MYNRYRDRDGLANPNCHLVKRYPYGGGTSGEWNVPFPQQCLGARQAVQDVYVKGFKPGRLTVKPCNMVKRSAVCTSGSITCIPPFKTYGTCHTWLTGQVLAGGHRYSLSGVPGTYNCTNRALVLADHKCYSNLQKPEAEVAVFLAEIRDTIGMVLSPGRALMKQLRKRVRPRNFRVPSFLSWHDVKKHMQNSRKYAMYLSDMWLGTRFGLLPLFSDVRDILNLSKKVVDTIHIPPYYTIRGGSLERSQTTSTATLLISDFRVLIDRTTDTSAGCHVGFYYNRQVSPIRETLFNFGLDPTQLLRSIWELVPFSFVVDEVINVGDWIESFNPTPDVHPIMGWLTQVNKTLVTEQIRNVTTFSSSYDKYVTFTGCIYQDESLSMNRVQRLPNVGYIPRLQNDIFNLTRVIDAASLIFQRMR